MEDIKWRKWRGSCTIIEVHKYICIKDHEGNLGIFCKGLRITKAPFGHLVAWAPLYHCNGTLAFENGMIAKDELFEESFEYDKEKDTILN